MAFQTYFLIHDRLGKKNFHFRFNLIKFGVDFKRLLLLLLFVYTKVTACGNNKLKLTRRVMLMSLM